MENIAYEEQYSTARRASKNNASLADASDSSVGKVLGHTQQVDARNDKGPNQSEATSDGHTMAHVRTFGRGSFRQLGLPVCARSSGEECNGM
jgi:hypothetical protein